MNPNNTGNLDPKLKEAYDRIMSGPAPQSTNQQSLNQTPISHPQPIPKMQTEQVQQQSFTMQNFISESPLPKNDEVLQSSIFKGGNFVNPNPSAQDAQETIVAKKKNKLLTVFLTVGGIIFFIIYAVVWSKVFGLF
jgi:hypothetical protein